jgi:DNA-binding transcriptional LysR family regulator
MIGRNNGDLAGREPLPQRFDLAARTHGRIDLRLAAQARDIVFFVQGQRVDAGFDSRVIAALAIGGAHVIAACDGTMDDGACWDRPGAARQFPRLAASARYGGAGKGGLRPQMEIDALAMQITILSRHPLCTVLPPSAVQRELDRGELVAHMIIEPKIARRLFVIHSGESQPDRCQARPCLDFAGHVLLSSRPTSRKILTALRRQPRQPPTLR